MIDTMIDAVAVVVKVVVIMVVVTIMIVATVAAAEIRMIAHQSIDTTLAVIGMMTAHAMIDVEVDMEATDMSLEVETVMVRSKNS